MTPRRIHVPPPIPDPPEAPSPSSLSIAVAADPPDNPGLYRRAVALAADLGLQLAAAPPAPPPALLIAHTPDRLEVRLARPGRMKPIYVDLTSLDTRSPAGRTRRQPLAKAVGVCRSGGGRTSTVIDATAGFGRDAWLLASMGCTVTAVERSPVVAALLRDGLARAAAHAPEVAARVHLVQADARGVLAAADPRPDVVFLDPMFPPRRGSAMERLSLRLLRTLVGPDNDARELLTVAARIALRRVVVKRPRHAEPLGGEPVASHPAKGLRYDVHPVGLRVVPDESIASTPIPSKKSCWARRSDESSRSLGR